MAGDELGGEPVSTNRWYVLVRNDDGYGVWRREDRADGVPVALFGSDADGFAAADAEFRRRTRQMRLFSQLPEALAWLVAVGVIAWFLMVAISAIPFLDGGFGRSSPAWGDLLRWSEEFMQLAYALWLGALALMATLWLLRRAREEPRIG